jgi:hypothetical protein
MTGRSKALRDDTINAALVAPIFVGNSSISRKMSACRHNSFATIGGWIGVVDAAVTRVGAKCVILIWLHAAFVTCISTILVAIIYLKFLERCRSRLARSPDEFPAFLLFLTAAIGFDELRCVICVT